MRGGFAIQAAAVLCTAALIGCGGDDAEEVRAADAETVVPVATPPAGGTTLEDTAAPVATQPAVLTISKTAQYGPYIADAGGRALYMFTADQGGTSNCYDQCAEMWPPFLSPAGTPRAGVAEVQPQLIGTTQRRDGSTQVTYGGHPLYFYHKDAGPGQATGQDVHDSGGEWYLVTPAGEKLEQH